MPSRSLVVWRTSSAEALDEIEAAHAAVGGTGRGRRYATRQINHAYAVLLCSQFQRFCRDLHSEAADYLTASIPSPPLRDILRAQLTENRKLDSGNPNPGNTGSDFGRLGIDFWLTVRKSDPRNGERLKQLQRLNDWRNAIAHQDFDPTRLGGRVTLRLSDVKRWRRICEALAAHFDFAIRGHLATILGVPPW